MCLFCNIVENKIPSKKVKESDDFLAFWDINPKAKIHILVIPKKHYDSFEEISPDVMSKMTIFIKELTKELKINNSGYRLITNIGQHGAQEVKHLHFHVLGGEQLKL